MNNTTSNIIIIGGIVAFLALLWFVAKPADAPQDAATTSETETVEPVTYVSTETNESVSIAFSDNQAVLTGAGYENVTLTEVPAASGAKYENTEQNVTVWSKGQDVTVYSGDEVVFSGGSKASLTKPAVPGDSLVSTTWVWQETVMNDDTVITPNKEGAFTLTFNQEGQVNGTTDCNNFAGTYTVEGDVLTMGPLAMTRMYCEGSQEAEFTKMLSEPTTFMINEQGQLVLMLPVDSGSVIFNKQ